MTHARLRAAALISLPLSLLLLTGCGVSAGSATNADGAAAAGPNASASAVADSKSDAGGDGSSDDGTAAFGKTYTYADGLAVTIVDKGYFKPSEYAAAPKTKHFRKFQVTVKNGTKKPFEPALFQVTLQDGEAEADSVIDVEHNIGTSPSTKLLPGRTVKWTEAFGVDTKDLVMEVTPDFGHDSVLFQGK